jgi:hypothetical protein
VFKFFLNTSLKQTFFVLDLGKIKNSRKIQKQTSKLSYTS